MKELFIICSPFFIGAIFLLLCRYIYNLHEEYKQWKYFPDDYKEKDKKKVIVTYNEFTKYYKISPNKYNITHCKSNYYKPIRSNYIIQFASFFDYKKYLRWCKSYSHSEHDVKSEKDFANMVQRDIDNYTKMYEKDIEDKLKIIKEYYNE